MRGKTMKDKSKKSTYSTTFGVDPTFFILFALFFFHHSTIFDVERKIIISTQGAKKPQSIEWLRVLNGGADEVRTHDL